MKSSGVTKIAGLAIVAMVLMLASFTAMAFEAEADCSIYADGADAGWVQQERPTRQQERPTRERQTQQREQPQRDPQIREPIKHTELGRFNLREGMTIPRDGRTIGRILTTDQLPRSGMRFDGGDDDCICVCTPDGCSPASCGNCPVPLCPGGYVPPCPDGDAALPGVYGVLDGMRELPPR